MTDRETRVEIWLFGLICPRRPGPGPLMRQFRRRGHEKNGNWMLPPVPPTLWFLLLVGISMSNIFTFAKISQKCEQSGLIALFLFTSPLLAWCFAKMHGQVWKAWFNQFTCQKVLWSCLQSKYHSGASLNHFVEMKNLQEFTVSIFRLGHIFGLGKKFYTVLMKYSLTIIVCSLSLNMVLFTFFRPARGFSSLFTFFLEAVEPFQIIELFTYFLVSLK